MFKFFSDLEFPYYKYCKKIDPEQMRKDADEFEPTVYDYVPKGLKKYIHGYKIGDRFDPPLEKFQKKYFFIYDGYAANEYINGNTNLFSESARVKCVFKGFSSPLAYWKKNKNSLIREAMKNYSFRSKDSMKETIVYNIRESMFINTRFCNNFRITVVLAILRHFKPESWLDISAGWGDRLLAGILYGIKRYVAVDPNLELHPCYDNMIKTMGEDKSKFTIHKAGFLEAKLDPKEMFDIVFAGPPFFDLETYSNYEGDSLKGKKTEEEWTDKFLIPSVVKAFNQLKTDHYYILYIAGNPYTLEKIHQMDKFASYQGIIYFYEKSPRTLYTWKKTKDDKLMYDGENIKIMGEEEAEGENEQGEEEDEAE